MHKALEWHRPGLPLDTAALRQALAAQYGLNAQQTGLVLQRVQTIVQGEGGWAWDDAQLAWQANEIDIAWQGRCWRIDRLVQRKAQGDTPASWWVLDFKSAFAPEAQQDLRQQLLAYRQAVQSMYPQQTVHAAFLTAEGRVVLLP